MRVSVVAEYYPGPHDPSQGIWAHRQALAARSAGADVRVLALHRPLPPLAALRRPGRLSGWLRYERMIPQQESIDGLEVFHPRFLAPPRPWSYSTWGAWAAPATSRALAALDREMATDLIHAHYAIPAGRAVLPFARRRGLPVVVSVHGGDILDVARRSPSVLRRVADTLSAARLVLCNSDYTRVRVAEMGVPEDTLRIVRLGASPPQDPPRRREAPTIVTAGYPDCP
jgi:hypothetical protein